MTIDVDGILRLVSEVTEDRNVKVCISNSLKGGAATGASATVGGMLLGPLGLAIGGTIGGILSYYAFDGTYKGIPQVIYEMNAAEKMLLAQKVYTVLNQLEKTDLIYAGSILAAGTNVQDMVLKAVVSHLSNTMKMNVIC